jgi:hypothetical protein
MKNNSVILVIIFSLIFLVSSIICVKIAGFKDGQQYAIEHMEVYSDSPVRIVFDGQEYWHNK